MSVHSSRGAAWKALRLLVLDRDGWVCHYCSKLLEGRDATVDHIIPRAAGGQDEPSNLVAACRKCNGSKQARALVRMPWRSPIWFGSSRRAA